MACSIFDGKAFAKEKEALLTKRVREQYALGKRFFVKTVTFEEDAGSRIYTKLKKTAAEHVGITYEPIELSLHADMGQVMQMVRELSFDRSVSGVMVQKPAKSAWMDEMRMDEKSFARWWEELVSCIDPAKDVDGLTSVRLAAVYAAKSPAEFGILPATVRAVKDILDFAQKELAVPTHDWLAKDVLMIGKSDIVGKPLSHILRKFGHSVTTVGRRELEGLDTKKYAIIIAAAGSPNVVTGDMVAEGAIVIDVGSPTNDVERKSVEKKAAFLTPVPGGVGPVTVLSLLENIVDIV